MTATSLEFRLLGPVQLWQGDELAGIGAPKQRAVLAVLLLSANRIVTLSQLTERLWGEHPPPSAKNTLQAYVYRLRQLLKPETGASLRTDCAGYTLYVPTGALDLHRFERLAEDGRRAAREGRPDEAHDLLLAALELWHGPPLADVATPGLDDEARRLADRRLAVAEDAAEAGLALGRYRKLIPGLDEMTTVHPYRERSWALLMTALSHAGRQADALAAYRRAHALLRDDLGIEPGPELRQVQQSILTGSLDRHPGHRADRPARAPRGHPYGRVRTTRHQELPADLATFVGRDRELADLGSWLTGSAGGPPRVATITGGVGVGKTALAVRLAHHLADHFPDGAFYAGMRASDVEARCLPTAVLHRWLHLLGVHSPPDWLGDAAALYRALLADRRMLIVLDDVADVSEVSPLLPAGSGCATLVVGPRPLTVLDNARHLALAPLDESDAVELLCRTAGVERVTAEQAAAGDIVRFCDRLPLAVRIAGARLAARPDMNPRTLAARLAVPHRRLDELALGGLSVRGRLAAAYARLPDAEAARVLDFLGRRTGSDAFCVSGDEIATVLGLSPARADLAVEALLDAHLVVTVSEGQYLVPPLVRLFAAEFADRASETSTPLQRTAGQWPPTSRSRFEGGPA